MRIGRAMGWTVLTAVLAGGCTGNGDGLDQNGNPIGSSSSSSSSSSNSGTLTADFTSIQDNVFTPICTRCHIGASAPEGLQLDAAHSYGLLVGVPSVEQPSVLRVDPGDPDNSYLIQKLEGASTISGGQMPLGGPYLPQATIDVIAQWITDGATMSPATMSQLMAQRAAQRAEHAIFEVVATSPPDTAVMSAPVHTIAVAFSGEVDAALVNATTITLEVVTPTEFPEATQPPLPTTTALAVGNPATVVIVPTMALGPGTYRVTVRGTGGGAIASVSGVPLDADYDFVFTVGRPR
jgi:methionine-rich copper-binding protein CopC